MPDRLPTVIVTSVIRAAKKGNSHGGVYVVDLETEESELVLDWDTCNIDWSGRGGDRGLRGVVVDGDRVYLAASDEVFVYDRDFQLVDSFRNRYLRACHEICLSDGLLYLSSTEYDSILALDVSTGRFVRGYYLRRFNLKPFDPEREDGPPHKDTLHLNNVHVEGERLYFACKHRSDLRYIDGEGLHKHCRIPVGTHNARPFRDGALYNYTDKNRVVYGAGDGEVIQQWDVRTYENVLKPVPTVFARQGWSRGLCTYGDLVITGYSPATVMVYDLGEREVVKTVNLSMDVRNAIHGLEIYA